ncbi:hypothetical protein P154DRAFT_625002 [Amniculicola lignicola CBS 123094]|uniref:Cation-transporting ATPase 4 n=1 Tax=Amniculicola lignicola CBS 123094 TaxID=1392246 RepID=A0A6A5W1L4_9PLEO|nr:hypothetical protein P154DRAFT_625002 [Amniculicola lignicola CBS 123094]
MGSSNRGKGAVLPLFDNVDIGTNIDTTERLDKEADPNGVCPSEAVDGIQVQSQEGEADPAVDQLAGLSDKEMDREYEFFVTTEEPHQPEGQERGLIRRLVMRNFFESKWAGPSTNTSESNSASTVQSRGSLKSRFRLPKPGQEFTEPKVKGKAKGMRRERGKSAEESEDRDRRERRPRACRTGSGKSGNGGDEGIGSRGESQRTSPVEGGEDGVAGCLRSKPRILLKINPSAHRFDPFDVLPVPGTPGLDMLFKLYRSGSRANSIAINARNTWWDFISKDAGLLHATLATWALYGMLVRGLTNLEVDRLKHKNEAIKEINMKIATAEGKISDELVGTALTLASFENLLGAYDAAQLHIAALKRMVNARGGLFAFGHNDGLIRGIIWVDFHSATAFHTPPSFPQIRLDPDTPPLPDALLEEAAYSSPTSLLQLSLASIDCFNIFYRLHRLGLAVSSHWLPKINRLTLSNLLYETEYILLSVPDYSRDFLDFDLEAKDQTDDDFTEAARVADGASVVEALLAGAQIFIYSSLREIPTRAKIFSILLERLRVAIERPRANMLDTWRREKNLSTLLWILVVASAVTAPSGDRSWWIGQLATVAKELDIPSELELQKAMQKVAWSDAFIAGVIKGLWAEVEIAVREGQKADFIARQYTCENGHQKVRCKDASSEGLGETTIDPRVLQERREGYEVGYQEGRWKVGGWKARLSWRESVAAIISRPHPPVPITPSTALPAATMTLVDNPQIKSASLHNPLPLQLHTYVWPFLVVWPAFLSIYLSPTRYEKYIEGPEWTFAYVGAITTIQSLFWLTTHWNVNLKSLFTTTGARDVGSATLIKVLPIANAGAAEIVELVRDNAGGKKNLSFLFQKRRFLYDAEKGSFAPLTYPLDAEPKPPLRVFQETKGLTAASEIERLQQHFGDNSFDIPVPTFTELFKEHAVAPFFVFQIFCVGLWMLDDYWYYSLFTLFMLVAFESTVVWQRQRTLNEFRGMSIQPYDLLVYRQKKWQEIKSDKLLPGDVVSVGRTKEDSGVACDMVLVEGSAIVNEAMLSGESTPVLKESVQLRPGDAPIETEGLDKNAMLYGGTKVLQVTHSTNTEDDVGGGRALPSGVPPPPDKGAVAVVVKTGFETSQGQLVRTMIYSTERVSANNVEALLFILFLCVFAVAASWYVWTEGVARDRKRSKLMLDCVLIITSVVPPELPMELSLAVNTSLAALSRHAIFCTEPFRIPYAGRVDVTCFDKTGTLTGEDLVVDGIAGLTLGQSGIKVAPDGAHTQLNDVKDIGTETTLVLATAHALVKLDEGDIVGEPMEKATLTSLGWSLGAHDTLTSKTSSKKSNAELVQIKRRFQFSSALKRQSSVATVIINDPKTRRKVKHTFVGVKGAPETIRKMLVNTPPHYEETFKHYTRNGGRVLALAYKFLAQDSELGMGRINDLKREQVECDLHFAGFLVLQCPLKDDAIQAVRMLNESSHRVVMITGDNPLTAVHVARQVEIVDRECLILDAPENDDSGEKLVWRSVDDKINIPVDPTQSLDKDILSSKDICVTGYALAKFQNQIGFKQLLRFTWVYARVSPRQKEDILLGLKECGYTTLMCGDGTNDVGALKQAHIGVALLNGTKDDLDKIGEHFRNTRMKEVYEKQIALMQRFNQPAPPVPVMIAHLYPQGPTNPHYEKAMERELARKGIAPPVPTGDGKAATNGTVVKKDAPKNSAASLADTFTQKMMESELGELDSEPPTIKLGDASVAAPFTSKLANVIAIPNIIRQGRCTLVATIQMYKILALNCLISAYSLSVLYLDGIKFGDGQVTISGMMMSVCFLSISRAKSVERLSKERPQHNIFNTYIIGSVLLQFSIHIATLIYVSQWVKRVEPIDPDIDLEKEFEPSLLNSAIYLLQLIQQISTFAINYQGRPFRESISENKGMYWGLILVSGVAFSCATEFIPEINEKLRLVPFTSEFKLMLTTTMILDYAGCWIVEKGLKALFSDYKPKDIAVRRPDQLKREEERRIAEEKEEQRKKNEEVEKAAREKGLVR